MSPTTQPSPAIQRAYRQILGAIADQTEFSGDPVSIEDLKALELTPDDYAAIAEIHLVDFVDLFAADPTKLARLFAGTLSPVELVWEVMQSDAADECANANERKQAMADEQYYGGSTMTSRERLADQLGVGALFK